MRPDHDAFALSPQQRARAVARILAASLLRVRVCSPDPAPAGGQAAPEIPPESVANCLELSTETRLSVQGG
jgi:hypothetical protein